MESLVLYVYLCVVGVLGVVSICQDFDNMSITPRDLHESTNFNMFGCIVAWIIGFIFNPIFFVAHFIHWIFHVRRKDDE